MSLRRETVEHPFGTIKAWMGATHFKMKTLKHVATEMALHVVAYNMKRVIAILSVPGLIEALKALLASAATMLQRWARWAATGASGQDCPQIDPRTLHSAS